MKRALFILFCVIIQNCSAQTVRSLRRPGYGGSLQPQIITLPNFATHTYGDPDFSPGATASPSGLPVSYSSDNLSVATIINGLIHIVGAGTANITASQGGNGFYSPAPPVTKQLTVNQAPQTLTFNPPPPITVGQADFDPGATSTSGLQPTYTSSNPAVATIVNNKVHPVSAGTTNITASQSGNGNYLAATPVSQPLTVNSPGLLPQTITFNSPGSQTYGNPDFDPGATASSGLGIIYTSANTGIITATGNILHIVGTGTVNITATQPGNTTYAPATNVTQPLTVNLANQTVNFPAIPPQSIGSPDFPSNATATSGLLVSLATSDPTVATVSGLNIHIVGAGTCNITASQSGNANYNAATPVIQPLTVSNTGLSPVDTTFEALYAKQFMDVDYDAVRPNKTVTLTASTSLSLNNVPVGAFGNFQIIISGSTIDLILNGWVNTTIPSTPGTYNLKYINNNGLLTWTTGQYPTATTISTALVQPNGFTYNLPSDENTVSAGIYNSNNQLIRTAFSNEHRKAGNHNWYWDGLDDLGNLQTYGNTYTLKVVGNNISYVWNGIIGNNSTLDTGSTTHRYYGTWTGMREVGNYIYYGTSFNEGNPGYWKLLKTNPLAKIYIQPAGQTTLQPLFVCANPNNVFWIGRDYTRQDNFTIATAVSNDVLVTFSSGVPYTPTGGPIRSYPSVIALNTGGPNGQPTGADVQQGGNQYLYISIGAQNVIQVYRTAGNTGNFIRSIPMTNAGQLALENDATLWVGQGTTLTKYTVNADGSITATGTSIIGFSNIAGLTVRFGEITVMDGGTQQIVKRYNSTTLALIGTIGTVGGYSTSPTVTNTKFYVQDLRTAYPTFVARQSDSSFWVGDPGNWRYQHFDKNGNYVNNIMVLPNLYNVNVCYNQNTQIFGQFAEYTVGYPGFSWSLTNNWGYNQPVGWEPVFPVNSVVKMANGRRYMLLEHNSTTYNWAELTTTGLRYIATPVPAFKPQVDSVGNLYTQGTGGAYPFQVTTYRKYPLTGFDGSNNPLYGAPVTLATIPLGHNATAPANANYAPTASGNLVFFGNLASTQGGGANLLSHLWGYNLASSQFAFHSSWETFTAYSGDFPLNGQFDIGNKVTGPGGELNSIGNNLFWNYHGEFWKLSETGYLYHYNDQGLLLGIFGVLGYNTGNGVFKTEAPAGYSSNTLNFKPTKVGSDIYIYANDESQHSGITQWHVSNLSSIYNTSVSGVLTFRAFTPGSTSTDLLAGLPGGQTTITGSAGWAQNPTPDQPAGTNQLYSRTRLRQKNLTLSNDVTFNGVGQINATYFQSRTLGLGTGLSAWEIRSLHDFSVNSFQGLLSAGRFYLTLVDVNGRVICRIEPYTNLTGGSHPSIFINTASMDITNPMYGASNFVLSMAGSQVHFFGNLFGQLIDTYQNVYDPLSVIGSPAKLVWNWQFSVARSQNAQFAPIVLKVEGK